VYGLTNANNSLTKYDKPQKHTVAPELYHC